MSDKKRKTVSLERGATLKKARESQHCSIGLAVELMNSKGIVITYDRYRALEAGRMPDERELRHIGVFLGIQPNDWLYSHVPELLELNETLSSVLATATPRVREMLLEMNKAGIKSAINQSLE